MGERKGVNKYYPPDFDPKKHKSLAGYTGAHPLRERARKLHKGILIIRFEMPYNIWCEGCNNHIGMGVRYNAEKSKIGNYYTTPIWKFRMKCHLCNNHFEIKTDPGNHDYVIISGARRKEQRWDPKENEQIVPEDKSTQKKLALDAMYKLEHGSKDQTISKSKLPTLGLIQRAQLGKKDDYLLNKMARNKFRDEKRSLKSVIDTDQALLERSSLDIELVQENSEDVKMAELLKYNSVRSFDEKQKQKREEIEKRSIFTPKEVYSTSNKKDSKLDAKTHLTSIALKQKFKANPFSSTSNSKVLSSSTLGIVTKKRKDFQTPSEASETESCSSASSLSGDSQTIDCDIEMASHFDSECQGTETVGFSEILKEEDNPRSVNSEICTENYTDPQKISISESPHVSSSAKPSALNSLLANYDTSSSTNSESD